LRPSLFRAALAGLLLGMIATPGHAGLVVHIDKSTQQMRVSVDGTVKHVWSVSTGRGGYGTPSGRFRPQRLERKWFSRKYYNSPMPHSIFFHKGYAIHGTNYISRLGGPASHGCVRLHPANAAALFALVRTHGLASTSIVVGGSGTMLARKRPAPVYARARARGPYRYIEPMGPPVHYAIPAAAF
jgi:hypothetical protein